LLLLQISMFTSLLFCNLVRKQRGKHITSAKHASPAASLTDNIDLSQCYCQTTLTRQAKMTIKISTCYCCRWALLCQLTSWFNAYCLVRTYSNSFEALCTVVGVYYWLLHVRSQAIEPSTSQHQKPPHRSKQSQSKDPKPLQPAACAEDLPVGQSKCPFTTKHLSTGTLTKTSVMLTISSRQAWLVAAAVGVLFRPSSMLFWLPSGEDFAFSSACTHKSLPW